MKFKIFILFFMPIILSAQFIGIKTLPLASGEQFNLFPSQNESFGGMNIAMTDAWAEAFSNPAKGFKPGLFLLPSVSAISNSLGGTETVPVAWHFNDKEILGSVMFSWQRLNGAKVEQNGFVRPFIDVINSDFKKAGSETNKYIYASLARAFGDDTFAGVSMLYADLKAVSGVDILYPNAESVSQKGDMTEVKTGLHKKTADMEWSIQALYRNFEMLQDVTNKTWFWNTQTQSYVVESSVTRNLDYTDTWGLHVNYREKVSDAGLTIGTVFTFNWKTHPKIPNYEIMNIPRDPGSSYAYNLGIGIAREQENSRIGLDFIFEPVWSNTWANAIDTIETSFGKIYPGQKTVENDFVFNNWILRFGGYRNVGFWGFGAGVELYKRNYNLIQQDYIAGRERRQDQDWMQISYDWGLSLYFRKFTLSYSGRMITGNGVPFLSRGFRGVALLETTAMSDFIVAPSGKVNVNEAETITHKFTIHIPLDGGQ
ncbi:MAG TPA: hypothetical protein ENJ10_06740 [Caldithrix abyssi]|uniref:Uncharacterized protein n=1 Tax=Caldithrix abyssi TaxID=187145 RepID=A0A7V1PV83_CALAY|nr:hypothetical protein [Caldithrix abyssi]